MISGSNLVSLINLTWLWCIYFPISANWNLISVECREIEQIFFWINGLFKFWDQAVENFIGPASPVFLLKTSYWGPIWNTIHYTVAYVLTRQRLPKRSQNRFSHLIEMMNMSCINCVPTSPHPWCCSHNYRAKNKMLFSYQPSVLISAVQWLLTSHSIVSIVSENKCIKDDCNLQFWAIKPISDWIKVSKHARGFTVYQQSISIAHDR